ncbi:MAG: hypothetical protein Q9218_004856 [Villophora microphyllina]
MPVSLGVKDPRASEIMAERGERQRKAREALARHAGTGDFNPFRRYRDSDRIPTKDVGASRDDASLHSNNAPSFIITSPSVKNTPKNPPKTTPNDTPSLASAEHAKSTSNKAADPSITPDVKKEQEQGQLKQRVEVPPEATEAIEVAGIQGASDGSVRI